MARPLQVSTARRVLMQGVMWIILGGTVGLAALVGHFRRSSLNVKLDSPANLRGVSVQLPKGWETEKSIDPNSATLISATEKESEGDEASARTIRIVRQPISSFRSPMEMVLSRLSGTGRLAESENEFVTVGGQPGLLIGQTRQRPPKSVEEAMTSRGMLLTKMVVAATVSTSGRGVAVELEGGGKLEAADIDLVKRVAATIKLPDDPPLLDAREIQLGDSIRVGVPADFSALKIDDPLITLRSFQTTSAKTAMRVITVMPLVMLPKDGAAALMTALSTYDRSFDEAVARQEDGYWRVDVDATIRRVFPLAAFAISKNGVGVLAIFRGGEDDTWIDGAWKDLRNNITFPENASNEPSLAAGAEEAQLIRETGLAKILPEMPDEIYWLLCLNGPASPTGWMHYIPGSAGGKFVGKILFDRTRQEVDYEWLGSADLKKYSTRIDYAITQLSSSDTSRKETIVNATALRDGKVELSPGGGKLLSYPAPPNFIPGGWLPLILGKLSDRPMILRTDSFVDYAYAQPTDLLTVTIRPEPKTRTEENPAPGAEGPLKTLLIEINGSGERSRWHIRADGSVDSVDYPQGQKMVRREKTELQSDFLRSEGMRP